MTAPVRVSQVVDGSTFSVLVSFDPARTEITRGGATVCLTALEAALFGEDLDQAATPPQQCLLCDAYAVAVIGKVAYCADHHHRGEVEANMAAGREQ